MKLKLLKKDILIKKKSINEITKSRIHLVLADEQKEGANYFEVVQVSPEVTEFKAGDTILLPFGAHTIPFVMDDGQEYAISDELQVMGVLEE